MYRHRKPHSLSPMSFPCVSHAGPSSQDCRQCLFPSLGPKVSGCEHKTCALVPLRVKKEKNSVFVSSRSCVSPADTNPAAFHPWVLRGLLILALALCAWKPSLWSWLLSFQGEAPTAVPPPRPATTVNGPAPLMISLLLSVVVFIFFPSLVKSLFFW